MLLLLKGTRWEANTCFDPPVIIGEHLVHNVEHHEEKTGLKIWDSSIALAKYLEKLERENKGKIQGKRIIELGSGCGLVGIIAGRLGANVVLTEVGLLVDQLSQNVKANNLESSVQARELFWGTDVTSFNPPYDIILASDVAWVTHLVEPLVVTLHNLSDEHTQIILAQEHRSRITDDLFFETLHKYGFKITEIPHTDHDHHFSDSAIDIYLIKK